MSAPIPEVVVIGGGFAGLYAARGLRHARVRVTLIDRRNFHLFQPLLYQVATGALASSNIAAPLRGLLRNQKNAHVVLGEVTDIDLKAREVVLTDGRRPFDYLVVAAGARHAYFGRPEWEDLAPGLKTVEDAHEVRRRVLYAFEMAERTADVAPLCDCWLRFVVVGGGPTGVETAGAITELARTTLRRNFRAIDPARAKVFLVQSGDRVLPMFHEVLSARALDTLKTMGVTVKLNARVTDIKPHLVTIKTAEGPELLDASTVIWAAGVQASPLAAALARATGAELDKAGRVAVGPDLALPGHPNVFVVGDMALTLDAAGKPVPGVAPAAMQTGEYAARAITGQVAGREVPPFRYFDKGSMATIGRSKAVAESMGVRMSGTVAWLAWLFIHILYLARFENRVLVLWQWGWNYVTGNRSARLIEGESPHGPDFSRLKVGVLEVAPPEKRAMMAGAMKESAPA